MNEKIKQLAEQAGMVKILEEHAHEYGAGTFENTPYPELEKFAELIVRECVEQIIAKGTDWIDFAPSQTGIRPEYWAMAQQIKQHFGVKE